MKFCLTNIASRWREACIESNHSFPLFLGAKAPLQIASVSKSVTKKFENSNKTPQNVSKNRDKG